MESARFVCMKGGHAAQPLVIVFSAVGSHMDDSVPAWMNGDAVDHYTAYPLNGARLEVLHGPSGLAVPREESANGDIIVDGEGAAWLLTWKNPRDATAFRLSDGAIGRPAGPREAHYREWRIVWNPHGADEPIEIARHPRG